MDFTNFNAQKLMIGTQTCGIFSLSGLLSGFVGTQLGCVLNINKAHILCPVFFKQRTILYDKGGKGNKLDLKGNSLLTL
jgi:hypothetical protein